MIDNTTCHSNHARVHDKCPTIARVLIRFGKLLSGELQTELCGVQTTETKISRNLDTSSFNKDTEPLYSRKMLHLT